MSEISQYAAWENLAEGQVKELAVGPLTRTDIVRFAGASGDFNPNHHDEMFAIRSGFEKVFAMGPLAAGYLSRVLTEWLGPTSLRVLQIRFTGQTWPGDTVICTAKVVRRYEENCERRVEIEAEAKNQNGETLIQAHATAIPQSIL